MLTDRRNIAVFAVLVLLFVLLTALIHSLTGSSPFQPSPYNSYTLQAMAWRKGQTNLDMDYPHLELAIYKGRYFVSFPPVPGIPVFLLSFIFGLSVPDGLLVMLYAVIALTVTYRLLLRRGFSALASAFWSFSLCFSSSMLPLIFSGAVWYQAQVMAFMLTVCAIDMMDRDHPWPGLALYALAVGCRPFNALYGPLLILLYVFRQRERSFVFKAIILKLLPGLLTGLMIALLYGWYNWIRFDDPLEFGHSFLPEFSFQGGTQFSLEHLAGNVRTFFFSLPFERTANGFQMKQFGFSLFISNPVLTLVLLKGAADLVKGRLKKEQGLALLTLLIHLFFLLLHRTFGGYQYGARYAVDLIPYSLICLSRSERKKLTAIETAILVIGFLMAVTGSLLFRLQ